MPEYRTYSGLDDRISKDGDVGFIGFNNRMRPDQLPPGMLADAQNLRTDRRGEAQVRKGIDLISNPLSSGSAALTLPFTLVADDTSVTATQTGGAVVLTGVTATNFPSSGTVNVSGVTMSDDPQVNGDRAFTKNSSTQITIADQTYSGTASGTATVKFGILNDGAVNAIYGSCSFSDPNASASQYIIFASNSKGVAVNISTGATTDIAYPTGVNVSATASMLQAFNKVFIFREGKTALEWNGSFSGTPAFTKVASGTYTQPVVIVSPASGFSITDNVATVDLGSGTHGLAVGNTITLLESNNSGLTVGDDFVVSTVVDANEFKFFVNSPDVAAHSGTVPEFSKTVSVGLGFSHMPAPPYAVYHQRRLVMPFKFSVDASTDSFTARGILDEVIASDILDTDTYDQIFAQYRFNAGEADFNVGLHSFSEDNLMVFNRNSIHLIANTTSLQAASTKLLTNEVGCVARQSISQVGNQVIFLSDNGVYSTQYFDEYNLRGTETPLSEPINETIKRIQRAYWHNSVAVYFDNRYFLAVPLDTFQDGTPNTSGINNAIIIYNFLNNQWESIDQVADTDFHISNLLVVGEGEKRGVYAVNDIGGVQKLNERVDGVDRIITQIGGDEKTPIVSGSLTTRQYTFESLERKNWKQFEMHIESGASMRSNFDISAETENPDANLNLGKLSDFVGSTLSEAEDVSIRGRIGNRRGYGIQFTLNNTTGRPKIRAIEADGAISFRSTNKAE